MGAVLGVVALEFVADLLDAKTPDACAVLRSGAALEHGAHLLTPERLLSSETLDAIALYSWKMALRYCRNNLSPAMLAECERRNKKLLSL